MILSTYAGQENLHFYPGFCYHYVMSYDIILFDADDTLFDFYHTGQKSFLRTCKTLGIPAEEKDYDIYSDINQKRWDLYSLGKISRHDVVIGRFEEYAKVKNISFDIEKFYDIYEHNLAETFYPYARNARAAGRI